MKIVNSQNLPQSVYKWLSQDFYDNEAASGTISATSLKKPIQEFLLTQRHKEELEVDATERIWSLFGSGIHAVLDKVEGQTEERLFAKVKGRVVSGKYDRVENNEVQDYKVTSVYTLIYGSREEDWRFQLSVYRWLYWKNKGVKLSDTGKIIVILRDWAQRDTDKPKYPPRPIMELPIDLYPVSTTQLMIEDKVKAIKQAEKLEDKDLPECTPEDRWFNQRKQQFIKCERYCTARAFCQQLKRYQEEK